MSKKYEPQIITVSPNSLSVGDTIVIDGITKTVGIGTVNSGFMGTTVEGQRYPNGIQKVLFAIWRNAKFAGYAAQP